MTIYIKVSKAIGNIDGNKSCMEKLEDPLYIKLVL